MPTGARIRTDSVFGTLTDNPLLVGAATMNGAGLANLAAVTGSDHAIIVLDPLRSAGAPEIVIVTAHTAAATSATITRGAYGTTARQHAQGVLWIHAPTIEDTIRIVTSGTRPADPYRGQLVFETDTNKFVGWAGTDWAPRDAGGQIGYAQVTANQSGITTVVDVTGLAATVTVGTGRRVRITGSLLINSTVANDTAGINIKEGATGLQYGQVSLPGVNVSHRIECVISPTGGAHTYKLTLERAAGTGSLTSTAAATFPAFILVEDIGAA